MNNFSPTNLPKDFYVYAYLRKDRTPYYIGKGKGRRAWIKHKRIIQRPKDLERIQIIKDGLEEQEAFDLEIKTITLYGRKEIGTGILRNFTDGGEGTSGYKHTEEAKQKIADAHKNNTYNVGRVWTQEQRNVVSKRMKGHSFFLGCKHTPESKKAMSQKRKGVKFSKEHRANMGASSTKKISVNGTIYNSAKEASEFMRISAGAVSHRALAKSYESRNWWYLTDGYVVREKWKHSEETKKHLSTKKMGNKNPNYGKKYSSEERLNLSKKCTNKRPILIKGVSYESINGAARILGVEKFTVRNRVLSKSEIFKDWKYDESIVHTSVDFGKTSKNHK